MHSHRNLFIFAIETTKQHENKMLFGQVKRPYLN